MSAISIAKLNDLLSANNMLNNKLEEIIYSYIGEWQEKIDEVVQDIDNVFSSTDISTIPIHYIETWMVKLTTALYLTSAVLENIGIQDDITKLQLKQKMSHVKLTTSGTAAQKEAFALNHTLEDGVINIIFNRSYKMLKTSVDAGWEMLNVLKKMVTRRMEDKSGDGKV